METPGLSIIFDYYGVIISGFFGKITPGISDVIRNLAKNNRLFIVSSSNVATIIDFLKKHELIGFFSEISGSESGLDKSHKILDLARTHGLDLNKTVMITDTTSDINSARIAGIRTVGVIWGNESKKNLLLAGADIIAEQPNKLFEIIKSLTET